MTDITLHLTSNFYPPIPHVLQLRVQEIFDEIVRDGMPWQIVDKDGYIIEQELENGDVLYREYTLPNGPIVTGQSLLDDLRLWEALFWDVESEVLDDGPQLEYAESKEVSAQLSFWENE
jgi:hypothetical protein